MREENRTTKIGKTKDGLFFANFGDKRYGVGCSIAETKDGLIDIWSGGHSHEQISKEQVKSLLPYLQAFVEKE